MRTRMTHVRGFTLVELVMVIIILGVVGVGVSNFMQTGTQIYVDVTERDKLLSESRFVVERLNRELRNALPNSVRVAGGSTTQCIEFVPVLWSTFYFDIPVAPETANDEIVVIDPSNRLSVFAHNEYQVVVYPTQPEDIYNGTSGHRFELSEKNFDAAEFKSTLVMDSEIQFATDSPGSRLYIVDRPVSYCMSAGQITRHANYAYTVSQSTVLGGGVLMAENAANTLSSDAGSQIGDPFRVLDATLLRNSAVIAMLQFETGGEIVVFNNEVHQPNVP